MPAGSDQLISQQWQPVAGAAGATIFPLIRKIDTISSNSYIIQTPDAILLIDPGGLTDQAEQLMRVIEACRLENDRPVFVFLTHAHIDHFIGAQHLPAFAYHESVVFAVQEIGAEALEQGDGKLTQANLLGISPVSMKTGFRLLTKERAGSPGIPVSLAFANGAEVTVTQDRIGADLDGGLVRERISFGPGPGLEIYHTPGHSPDSICIRIGELLFVGDILFAANPGIAGLCGWSQEALIHSLLVINGIISGGGIHMLCPGHGRVILAADAARMLTLVRNDALALSNIAELNDERAQETAAFAEDCMDEVNEIFTIMAGRLYYLSYVMDELGEPEIAERLHSQFNGDAVDELLEAFKDFADEHHNQKNVSIYLALKAGQVIAKLDRAFKKDELAHLIDPTMVQRAGRLLSDYTTMLRGFCPPGELSECDIAGLVKALVTGLSVPACSDDDMLDSADDDAAFVQMLLARAGARPLLEEIDLTLKPGKHPIPAVVDSDHFSDLLTYILEELVGTGSRRIIISTEREKYEAFITISGDCAGESVPEKKKTWNFLEGLCKRAGGTLAFAQENGMSRFVVTVSLL
ncbi:MBL fold metallo-hydrolase [uncultured Methanoregula sp.]|uniref:MBL fold metallo-hydrolase n=1 Tax=uncultured Methanoregula sp. TaxID=1005933 RepID=UPI002AAB0342|nr:MBL fold metallo-hydrolase [uncultured Methanoregula sp.]